jgi:oligosaccharyltransferase complex subunit epsilon
MASTGDVVAKFIEAYKSTPKPLKLIDCFLVFIIGTAVIQFIYCCIVGTFPFNSFLAGFMSCIGMFVLTVCLRMQIAGAVVSKQRAFGDYVIANLVLHFAVLNFIG